MTARDTALDYLAGGAADYAQVQALLYIGDQIAALRETLDTPHINVTDLDAAFHMPPQWAVRDPERAARLAMTYAGDAPSPASPTSPTSPADAEQAERDARHRVIEADTAVTDAMKNAEAARESLVRATRLAAAHLVDLNGRATMTHQEAQAAAQKDGRL